MEKNEENGTKYNKLWCYFSFYYSPFLFFFTHSCNMLYGWWFQFWEIFGSGTSTWKSNSLPSSREKVKEPNKQTEAQGKRKWVFSGQRHSFHVKKRSNKQNTIKFIRTMMMIMTASIRVWECCRVGIYGKHCKRLLLLPSQPKEYFFSVWTFGMARVPPSLSPVTYIRIFMHELGSICITTTRYAAVNIKCFIYIFKSKASHFYKGLYKYHKYNKSPVFTRPFPFSLKRTKPFF